MVEINVLLLIEFLLLAIVCFFLIRYYKGHMVTWDVSITVYISWVLGFAGILLLPYDLSVAEVEDLQSKYLYEFWNAIYWSTFILAWIVLPIQLEYHNSGHFTFSSKLKDAIRKNLLSLGIAGLGGIIYIVYMVASGNGSPTEVISFMMAMGNTYGVLIIIFLMGNGLVGLPRRLWQIGDSEAELVRMYLSAVGVESAYQEARYELEDCELEVTKISKWLDSLGVNSKEVFELGPLISILNNSISNFEFAGRSNSLQYVNNNVNTRPHSLDGADAKSILVNLRARLLNAQIKARACERRWNVLLKRVKRLEKIVNGESVGSEDKWCEQRMEIGSNVDSNSITNKLCKACKLLYESSTNITNSVGLKHICRVLSVVCALASAVILWSELVMTTQLHSPIGIIIGSYDKNPEKDNIILVQIVSFLALSYMSICTYWSLFRINLGWSYTLQGPQLSSPSSLIFNGEYFSRLQFSLGYNFLLILNAKNTTRTSFSLLMSNITLIPVFGTSFIVYVPILIIFIALITLFNCMSRLLRFVGVESEDAFSVNRCCTSKILSDEDSILYDSGKKLVSSAQRLMARGKEEIISPAHENTGRQKLREKYESIHKSIDENDNDDDDETSIELNNLQRIESGMGRLPNTHTTQQSQSLSFFSGINNAISSYSKYEKIEKSNVNPVHSANRSKDFSFEDEEDNSRYTGRYG